jgi:hypothetical protein
LYGVLIAAAAPLYAWNASWDLSQHNGISYGAPGPRIDLPGLDGVSTGYIAVYWLFSLLGALWLTGWWYRRRARQVGLVTSVRGFIAAGVAVTAADVLVSVFPSGGLLPGDLIIRGTFPLVIIAIGLYVLAWAERSWGLAVTAALYTAAALLASLYNLENILFRLGWNPSLSQYDLTVLPGILLPALILLAAGLVAFAAQRRVGSAAAS